MTEHKSQTILFINQKIVVKLRGIKFDLLH